MNRLLRLLLAPPDPLRPFRRFVVTADAANAGRDWPLAARAYGQALRIDPLRDDLWVQYGHALKEQGRLADAEKAYASAAAVAPGSADAALHLGELRQRLGRPAEAAAAFRRALTDAPDHQGLRDSLVLLGDPPPGEAPSPPFRDVDDLAARDATRIARPEVPPASGWPSLASLRGRFTWGRRRDPILFLHLHKTGGLTLDDVLAAHVAPGRICPVKDDHLHVYDARALEAFDLFSGHVDVGALRLIGRPVRTLSLFREPTARLISFYRFHAGHDLGGRHGVNDFARMANAMSAELFFEDERVRRAPEVFNHYLTVFSLTYAQVKAAARVAVDRVDPATVERAVARVRGLDAVGVLERFDDSATLACATLGLPPPRTIRPRNQTNVLARRMKGAAPPPVVMTARLEAALADLVRFDRPIYEAARAEFERRWAVFQASRSGKSVGA